MEVRAGYKLTDVGVIPENWSIQCLGNLVQTARSIRYGIVQPGKFEPNGSLMLRSQDYSKGWAGPDGMHRISGLLENQYRNARLRHMDLIMTVVGAGIGQVVVAPDWLDGAIASRSTARIAIAEEKATPSFVRAFLESPSGKRQILDCQKEGAQPVVSCIDLGRFLIACPPLTEQRAIAEALNDADALLAGLDRLIAKKRDLKQAAMQQLLTGQTRLPGFDGEWEVKRLGDIAEIISGGTPRTGEATYWNGGIKWCTPTDITRQAGKYLADTERTISSAGLNNSGAVLLPVGALLLCSRATIGEVKIAAEPMCTNQGFKSLVCRPGTNNEFLYYKLLTMKQKMVERAFGSTFLEISTRNVSALEMIAPPINEQVAIAAVLSDMDAELAALEARRDKTRALKQGMMQELLTGRTRLV
jgi:type I restriction enzyme S subunit